MKTNKDLFNMISWLTDHFYCSWLIKNTKSKQQKYDLLIQEFITTNEIDAPEVKQLLRIWIGQNFPGALKSLSDTTDIFINDMYTFLKEVSNESNK